MARTSSAASNCQKYGQNTDTGLRLPVEDSGARKRSLEDYWEMVNDKRCRWCGSGLGPIEHHNHDGGWEVTGFDQKQWLYCTCKECQYEWALWKLGCSR